MKPLLKEQEKEIRNQRWMGLINRKEAIIEELKELNSELTDIQEEIGVLLYKK